MIIETNKKYFPIFNLNFKYEIVDLQLKFLKISLDMIFWSHVNGS